MSPKAARQPRHALFPLEPIVLDGHRVKLGDLTLDLAARTVVARSRRTVPLSDREFTVLAMLIKDTGRFVTAKELSAALKDTKTPTGSAPVHPAVLSTYVRYLRHRLQDAKSAVTIEETATDGFRLLP